MAEDENNLADDLMAEISSENNEVESSAADQSAADAAAAMMGEDPGTAAADAAAAMMGENTEESAEDAAAAMLGDQLGSTADEAPIVAGEEATSVSSAESPASPAAPEEPKEAPHIEAMEKQIELTNLLLEEVEGLIIAKVYNNLHQAYYDSWVRDARDNHMLIMRLNRRLRRYRGQLKNDKVSGNAR